MGDRLSDRAKLVILNADDWGASPAATDAIRDCFEVGGTTSASAMVHMRDSERAALIAQERGLPIGLHLNLTTPFDSSDAPSPVRERQLNLVRSFRRRRLKGLGLVCYPKRWLPYPHLNRLVRDAVADQLTEFRRLYGSDPSHIDGHHDVHLCPTVLLCGALPAGSKVRNIRRFRLAGNRVISEQLVAPDVFMSMRDLKPWGSITFGDAVGSCDGLSVIVAQHPHLGECQYLQSEAWLAQVRHYPLGSFHDLMASEIAKT